MGKEFGGKKREGRRRGRKGGKGGRKKRGRKVEGKKISAPVPFVKSLKDQEPQSNIFLYVFHRTKPRTVL